MGNLLDCSSGDTTVNETSEQLGITADESLGSFVLEKQQPILNSMIWRNQREYFASLPTKLNGGSVAELSASCNSFIAKAYANVIMGYVLDWYSNPSNDTSEPMYIIDIGAGFGKLSYLIMYSLLEMKEHWPSSDHPPFVYVVSDCSKDYVSLWQRDPYLSQFAQMGYLDFAVFDCAADTNLILINSHLSISPDSLHTPPFFLCSCVFSTLPQDVIKVEQTLSRGNLSVYQAPSSLDFHFSWEYEGIADPESLPWWPLFGPSIHTSQSPYARILTIPAVAGSFLLNALAWSENRGVFLIADEGVFSAEDPRLTADPSITMAGFARLPVNFPLLAELAGRMGGFARVSGLNEGFRAGIVAFGMREAALRRTLRWAKVSLSDFTPSTYFDLVTSLSAETSLSAQTIFYLLRLSCGDADVFWKYRNRLLAQPSAAGNRGNVRVDLGLIRDHVTHSKGSNDVCFELGRLYMGIGDYQTALELFEESNDMVYPHHVTWFNMGVCAYFLEDLDNAKRYFSQSLQLKPTFEESRRWLQLLTEGNLEALRVLAESMQRSFNSE